MSQRDHNTLLCALHLGWGGINLLALSAARGVSRGEFAVGFEGNPWRRLASAMGWCSWAWDSVVFFLIFFLFFSFPFLVAGYGMLKRRTWARGAGVVAAIMASLSFPFGTALCVYTLWFLFGEGRNFYEQAQTGAAWTGASDDASTATSDWRDES